MTFIVLDTDAASAVLRGRVSNPLTRQLTGQSLTITFVTVDKGTRWTLVHH